MKQKGLPLVSNKAAPCTVLSHSLVDCAPHVHQTHRYIHTDRGISYNRASHIWHKLHPATVFPSSTCFFFDLDEPMCELIHLSKGSGLLLIHKMTLVWSLFFFYAEIIASTHYKQGMRLGLSFLFSSVNPLSAFGSSTVAGELVLTLHSIELVVETQLEDRDGNHHFMSFTLAIFNTYIDATA